MARADEIGTSIGTGLTRACHRLADRIDNKSRPNSGMPNWWISSRWVEPDDDDDDDDDDGDDDDENEDDGANNNGNDNETIQST